MGRDAGQARAADAKPGRARRTTPAIVCLKNESRPFSRDDNCEGGPAFPTGLHLLRPFQSFGIRFSLLPLSGTVLSPSPLVPVRCEECYTGIAAGSVVFGVE